MTTRDEFGYKLDLLLNFFYQYCQANVNGFKKGSTTATSFPSTNTLARTKNFVPQSVDGPAMPKAGDISNWFMNFMAKNASGTVGEADLNVPSSGIKYPNRISLYATNSKNYF